MVQQVCLIMYSGLQQPSLTNVEQGSKELLSIRAATYMGCTYIMVPSGHQDYQLPACPESQISKTWNQVPTQVEATE
jgi:hypothetical protein